MIASLALSALAAFGSAPQDPQPIRVLVLLGGEHHAYEGNSRLLLTGLGQVGLSFTSEVVRIDDPPAGKPAAEPKTLPSKPDILKDPELGKKYDVIIQYTQDSYLEKLTSDHVDGLTGFVRGGGGWVGIHCALDTWKSWPEYVAMAGGKFQSHPPYGPLTVQRLAASQEMGAGLEDFETKDELYHLDDCAADKNLLYASKSPGDGKLRPVAWTRGYGLGRTFATVLGHGPDSYKHPMFLKMIRSAVEWTARAKAESECAPIGTSFSLFNGRNLDGWTMTGPGRFVVENGALVSQGGMGLLWYSRRSFRDFSLELEWKADRKEENSGIFVRFPMPLTPWTAVNAGYEVQICDAADAKHNTGSIYSFQAASKMPVKAPGEWNHYRIEVRGQQYTIWINGEKVNEYTGSRSPEGFLGLQNHDDSSKVAFRALRVTELR